MLFKDFFDAPCGLRYMLESLQLVSSCGRSRLLSSEMLVSQGDIEESYKKLRIAYRTIYETDGVTGSALASLKHKLMCLRDISGTISRLANKVVLDDIDLFEIKYIALLAGAVRGYLEELKLGVIEIPDLEDVVKILDPDGMRVESFYVYDSYSKELGRIRGELKKLQGLEIGRDKAATTDSRITELIERERLLERKIRENLSDLLREHAESIKLAVDSLGDLDVLLAKCLQIKEMGLCFPEISSDGRTLYEGMFHPQILSIYEEYNKLHADFGGEKKRFTPIDIEFVHIPISIIGANMGGKTVVLKMLALNQLLFQFGFGIPAKRAEIEIKDEVRICIGDEQDELSGLSSFAGEIKAIDGVLQSAAQGKKLLALIDEPARTTNPIEGTALVAALLNVLKDREISLIITTHYNIPGEFFRRLRVNGLVNGKMDYRLGETKSGDIPHEAINIAKSLKVNEQWIGEAEKFLDKKIID